MVKRGPIGPRKKKKLSVGQYAKPSFADKNWRFVGFRYVPEQKMRYAMFSSKRKLSPRGLVVGDRLSIRGQKCKITKLYPRSKKMDLVCI